MDEDMKREIARLEVELRELERLMAARLGKVRRRIEKFKKKQFKII